MRRMIRHKSSMFPHRMVAYSYPQLRPERPRVTERESDREPVEGPEAQRDEQERAEDQA